MIVNPHGWRARYIAAQERSEAVRARRKLNAARWAHYEEIKWGPKNKDPEPAVFVEDEEPKEADYLTNAEIRSLLDEAGLEVPKNTARARLIELYEEHVEKKDD
jgi:hypothetical protein